MHRTHWNNKVGGFAAERAGSEGKYKMVSKLDSSCILMMFSLSRFIAHSPNFHRKNFRGSRHTTVGFAVWGPGNEATLAITLALCAPLNNSCILLYTLV